jgi:hypothetical protein
LEASFHRPALHPLRGRIVKTLIGPVSINEDGIIHDRSPDDTSQLMSASNEDEDAPFPHAVWTFRRTFSVLLHASSASANVLNGAPAILIAGLFA